MGIIFFDIQSVLVTLVCKIVRIFILLEKMAEKISIIIDGVNYQSALRSLNENNENEKKIGLCKLLAFTM